MDALPWEAYNKFINNPIFYTIIEEEKSDLDMFKLRTACHQIVVNKEVFKNLWAAENTQSSASAGNHVRKIRGYIFMVLRGILLNFRARLFSQSITLETAAKAASILFEGKPTGGTPWRQ
ncbi:hypothetical protein OCU04_008282 [Sclerotinia nivalis]|uniref:Uncharacterized protein n=1 Tax=Sclerotinia nivalis TaxID=352851 RepID=A0A9X0AIV2_9HELO|nr:hypothetical protein OCU04_008282 [Sclerotinia nivalis]